MKHIKSPINYTGNKYRLLKQIKPLLPQTEISTFVDLFTGSGTMLANVKAQRMISNDICYQVVEVLSLLKQHSNDPLSLISKIERRVKECNLTKEDEIAYYNFRQAYNENPNPLDLFVLICFSFSNIMRFNGKGGFNVPFGGDRSFNPAIKANLVEFCSKIADTDIEFSSNSYNILEDILGQLDSNSFIYADPPYTYTGSSYNAFWTLNDELKLTSLLDEAHRRGIKFAMSNVIEHKGVENIDLIEWSKSYNVHLLNFSYSNASYNTSRKGSQEVLITNY